MLIESLPMTETLVITIVSVAGAVAIVWAIVFGVISVTNIAVRHRERMAAIGMKAHPELQSDSLPPSHDATRDPIEMRPH